MLEYHKYYTESDGNHLDFINLISIHFGRLSIYRKDWYLEEIIIYEAMLVLSRMFGNKPFYYQMPRLKEFTNLSKHKLKKYRKRIVKLGVLSYERKGQNRKHLYTVHYDAIKQNLENIYDFSNVEEGKIEENKRIIRDFFDYWGWNPAPIREETYRNLQNGGFELDHRNPFAPDKEGIKRHQGFGD